MLLFLGAFIGGGIWLFEFVSSPSSKPIGDNSAADRQYCREKILSSVDTGDDPTIRNWVLCVEQDTWHYVAQDRPLHVVVGGCALSSEGVVHSWVFSPRGVRRPFYPFQPPSRNQRPGALLDPNAMRTFPLGSGSSRQHVLHRVRPGRRHRLSAFPLRRRLRSPRLLPPNTARSRARQRRVVWEDAETGANRTLKTLRKTGSKAASAGRYWHLCRAATRAK